MATKPNLVFVFGTLKRGYTNYERLLKRAKFIGPALSVDNNYIMQDVGFPTLWQQEKIGVLSGRVKGEVFALTDQQLRSCDWLEGNGRMYTREQRLFEVLGKSGGEVTAWVYLWNLQRDNDPVEPVGGVLVWDQKGKRRVA